jgi:linoleoyl-CoA desaturase
MTVVSGQSSLSQKDTPKQKIIFDRLTQDSFQKDVSSRVDDFFKSKKISKNANSEMVFKTVWILAGWIATYGLIISNLFAPWLMFLLALAHGFFTAMIGLNVSHDAIHGSYTKCPKRNKKLGLSFNFIGVNDYVWTISHNIVHHTYTNIPEHDEDIEQVPILRLQPNQELWKIHRFQYIYAFFLYSLSTFFWVLIKDYKKFFQRQLGGYFRKTFPKKEIFRLFAYKAFYYFMFLVLGNSGLCSQSFAGRVHRGGNFYAGTYYRRHKVSRT